MARQAIVQGESPPPEDEKQRDAALRPRWLKEVVGQKAVVQRLGIALNAAKKLNEPLSHILFDGPPGLGKTTFATVLPTELGTSIQMTSGPALTKPMDLMPFLTNADERSILFIDEIHRMPRVVEEFIYPAMEDFRVDIVLGEGINARTISMTLKHFTLIGATTRSGMLSGPMRDRFKMHEHLEFYTVDELAEIITINARKLKTPLTADAAAELARRSRGTPRIANNLLRRVRDYAQVRGDGRITSAVADLALAMLEIDQNGLDEMDKRILEAIIVKFGGGPVGIGSLAVAVGEEPDTIEEVYEPYLIMEGYLNRTTQGRVATELSYQKLNLKPGMGIQPKLF
jgi:Holliday junction DNA helicase RuvB